MVQKVKQKLFILVLLFFPFLTTAQESEKKDGIKFGGALRYNIISTDYESSSDKTDPQFTWDTWRLNMDGSIGGIDLSFEYRFYPSSKTHFLKHGYFGYKFSDVVYGKLGVSQVPFGVLDYASHSYFFQAPYYVGLEDDYDMGIKFDITPTDDIDISLAYFRQAEPNGSGPDYSSRYAYDIVPGMGAIVDSEGNFKQAYASLSELNQFNARVAWRFVPNWEAGLSGQVGGIYNSELDKSTTSGAFAAHLLGSFSNFTLKSEFIHYNYRANDDAGNRIDVLQMGAYGGGYPGATADEAGNVNYTGCVATKANIYAVSLAYSIPVNWGPITNIQPYVDYSFVDKANEHFYDTQHLIPGFMVTAGPIYAYFDYAMGKNQPWLTDDFGKGLGSGVADAEWNKRFNINLGYYF